jgi:hypothetical protein
MANSGVKMADVFKKQKFWQFVREIFLKKSLRELRFIAPPARVKDTLVHAIPEDHKLDTSFNTSNFL